MPRTKVCRNIKRNREIQNFIDERLREFDAAAEQELNAIDLRCACLYDDFSNAFSMIKKRLNKSTLEMTMVDFFTCGMNIKSTDSMNSDIMNDDGSMLPARSGPRKKSKDDGYLTEDSTNTGPIKQLAAAISVIGKSPGPLSLTKGRSRRSRSACDYLNSALKTKYAGSHSSRSKLRTPQPTPRAQVLSVDRALITPKINTDSSPAVYRWPKQGEKIFSMSGSPVVVPIIPDLGTNANIRIRNGMLSLRAKKLDKINKSFVEKIDSETLMEIKQLQSNLGYILKYVEQSSEF